MQIASSSSLFRAASRIAGFARVFGRSQPGAAENPVDCSCMHLLSCLKLREFRDGPGNRIGR